LRENCQGFGSFLAVNAVYARANAKASGPKSLGKKSGDDTGPKAPNISKPDTNSLLKRLRSIDPDQSRKYRQRSGE
jgi:hypothetical protein